MGRRLGGANLPTGIVFDPAQLGGRIRSWRLEQGWSALRLAEAVGVDRSYLSRLERGEVRQPATDVLEGLRVTMGLSTMDDLLRMSLPDIDSSNLPEWTHKDSEFLYDFPSMKRVTTLANLSRQAHQEGRLFHALELARTGYAMLLGLGDGSSNFLHHEQEVLYRLAEISHDLRHTEAADQYITTLMNMPELPLLREIPSPKISPHPDDIDFEDTLPSFKNSIENEAHIYRASATIHAVLGEWAKAEKDYETALEVTDKAVKNADQDPTFKHLKGRILNSQCWFLLRKGNLKDAARVCEESLRLKNEAKARARSTAYNYNHRAEIRLASLQLPSGDVDASAISDCLKDFKQAADGFEAYKDWRNYAEVHLNLAAVELYRGGIEAALLAANTTLKYATDKATWSFLHQVKAHRMLGEIHLQAGDFRAAEDHLKQSNNLRNRIQDKYEVASTYRVMGELMLAKAQSQSRLRIAEYEEAGIFLDKALKMFEELRGPNAIHRSVEERKTEASRTMWEHAAPAASRQRIA